MKMWKQFYDKSEFWSRTLRTNFRWRITIFTRSARTIELNAQMIQLPKWPPTSWVSWSINFTWFRLRDCNNKLFLISASWLGIPVRFWADRNSPSWSHWGSSRWISFFGTSRVRNLSGQRHCMWCSINTDSKHACLCPTKPTRQVTD